MQSIGSQILAAAKARNPVGHHPRIIMTEADFARLRENRENGIYKKLLDAIFEKANKALLMSVTEYEIPDGIRLLGAARRIGDILMNLSIAYLVSGEKRYLERAIKEIEAACAFPDFNPFSYLGSAELCNGLAVAYDWLYNDLSEQTRALLREALVEKGLKSVMEEYEDAPEHKNCLNPKRGYKWYQDKPGDNWKMVCNGSLALSVLAIYDEIDYGDCEKILTYGFEDTYEAVRTFYNAEDGTYSEGPNYWNLATQFLAYYSKGLITAAGSDFGLTDAPGVRLSPYSVLSLASPDCIAFNFGDAGVGSVVTPAFSWCAEHNGDIALYNLRRPAIEKGMGNYSDVIFFRDADAEQPLDLPLSFGREGGDNAAFRAESGADAFFAAIHLAKNNVYHGHNDMGTFVMNIGNKRFFVDLGGDDYNLKPYRDSYRFRAEGHNTIVLNPETGKDNAMEANCNIFRFSDGEDSFAIGDMSEAFPGKRVIRGLKMLRESGSVILQDEIECSEEDTVRWSAHTPASVAFRDEGKGVILDMDGTQMYVRLLSEGYFSVRAAAPDEHSPIPSPALYVNKTCQQAKNDGIQKLVLHLTGKKNHTVAVWFYPLTNDGEIPKDAPVPKPLAIW